MNDTKLKILRRLAHNAAKIKDPTIKQLLTDSHHFIFNSEDTPSDLQAKLDKELAGQVAVFEGEEWPVFRQGEPDHELEHLLTAEEANRMVEALKRAKVEQDDNDYQQANVAPEDKDALNNMRFMVENFERAGFIGIIETYKSAKHKFPGCVTAQRKNGEITAFDVELPDGTVVTLRNPECVAKEQTSLQSSES